MHYKILTTSFFILLVTYFYCLNDHGQSSTNTLVSGIIICKENKKTIENSKVIIELRDISNMAAPSILLAKQIIENATTFPIAYELTGDIFSIFSNDNSKKYAVSVDIYLCEDDQHYIGDFMSEFTNEVSSKSPANYKNIIVDLLEDCNSTDARGFCSTRRCE